MERLISGLWWAVVLGVGAFIGIMLFSQNLDHAIRTAMGTFICAFFLGLFLEVPGFLRGKDSIKRVIDWNFVAKWSVGFSIFLFGFMCMTARDTGIRAYNLGAINNQQISWTAVEQKIIPQVFIGGIVSFVLLIVAFVILTLWAYFVRKNKTQSVDKVQKEVKLGLDVLFGFSAIIGLMLLYYSLVENRGHALAVEGVVIVALAYFTRSKAILIACYVLLAAFLYLLVKYSIAIEGNRLLVLSLSFVAIYAWVTSCLLWKVKPLFNFQQNKSKSENVVTDSIRDKFYKVAYDEITINRADPVLWAKAFAHAEGNQDKAKALYIKYRVEQLSALPVQQPQAVFPADSTELPAQHEVAGSVYGKNKSAIAVIVVVGLVGVVLLISQIQKPSLNPSQSPAPTIPKKTDLEITKPVAQAPTNTNSSDVPAKIPTNIKPSDVPIGTRMWLEKNQWYIDGSNQQASEIARKIDIKLQEEGFKPDDPEMYIELNRRLKAAMPNLTVGDIEVPKKVLTPFEERLQKANSGDISAQYQIGINYGEGLEVQRDDEEAFKWFYRTANQGHKLAQNNLGFMYSTGRGVLKNEVEAAKWYLLAANQGLAESQKEIGVMYANGRGVQMNEIEAVRWYQLAANQGLAEAQSKLGGMYADGRGVQKNEVEAVRWYRLAANQGDVSAQFFLGFMYAMGRGIPKNEVEAVRWYRLAADQGYFFAQLFLGHAYSDGIGVPKDYVEAFKWYQKAAEKGDAGAQNNLGFMYSKGLGIAQNYPNAISWFRKSAEQGNATAQYMMGYFYAEGLGESQSFDEAIKWYTLAAKQGHVEAQAALGEFSEINSYGNRIIRRIKKLDNSAVPKINQDNKPKEEITPCVRKPVMSDEDYRACGIKVPTVR